jgi:hypothetical protein
MTPIHTAAFYFGWAALVVAAFFVVHFVRIAASAFGEFWTTYISPLLTRCNALMEKYSGTLLISGVAVTLFGTLVCAASTRWLAITDVRSFIVGILILVVGMAATIRAAD